MIYIEYIIFENKKSKSNIIDTKLVIFHVSTDPKFHSPLVYRFPTP